VVENQPFSLVGLTIIKPIQAHWLPNGPATLVSMVEKREIGQPMYTVEKFKKEWLFLRRNDWDKRDARDRNFQ